MSVEENLRCAVRSARKSAFRTLIDRQTDVCERAEWLMVRVGLNRAPSCATGGVFSYAGRRALEIRVTIAAAAAVLLLDEPTARMNNGEIEQAVERD